jgi:hypothetical protein
VIIPFDLPTFSRPQFSASQKLMDEQVTTLQKAVRQLTFERDQLAEQVK